jgi:hypothetical protein
VTLVGNRGVLWVRYSPCVTPLDKIDHYILDGYRTCEFATLAKDGTPLAWPTSPLRQQDGTLLITTSIGFAQKALNVRRDGRVALLFSDPTGSGLTAPSQVFVSGTARCSELTTSPEGLEEYWSMLYFRQPSSRSYTWPGVRSLMDWYYMRLLITVTPERVAERPAGSVARPALAQLASAQSALAQSAGTQPTGTQPATTQSAGTQPAGSPELAEAWERARRAGVPGAGELAGYPTAVLAARDAEGGITLARTAVRPAEGGYLVATAPDAPLAEGPASLLVHRHDDKLSKARFALVRGQVARPGPDADWFFAPGRVVKPAANPLRTIMDLRASSARYLRNRSLQRPAIPWEQYRALARHPADRGRG